MGNFALTYAKELLQMGLVRTVVEFPKAKNDMLEGLMGQLIKKHPSLATSVYFADLQKQVKGLGDLVQQRQSTLDTRCAMAEQRERSLGFVVGLYGLLLLLINGFFADLDAARTTSMVCLANITAIAGVYLVHKFLIKGLNASSKLDEVDDWMNTKRPWLFTRITSWWLVVVIVLFIWGAVSNAFKLRMNLFDVPYAAHLSVIFAIIISSLAFAHHFASRHALTRKANKEMNDRWDAMIAKVKSHLS